jgi:hypothetical protein
MSSAATLDPTDPEFGEDLRFTHVNRPAAGGGSWVIGVVAGHQFEALVYRQHAEDRAWELGDSRISKLWVRRIADRAVVFNWDRGPDVPAGDPETARVVDFLVAGLAEHVFG